MNRSSRTTSAPPQAEVGGTISQYSDLNLLYTMPFNVLTWKLACQRGTLRQLHYTALYPREPRASYQFLQTMKIEGGLACVQSARYINRAYITNVLLLCLIMEVR
jgi:hypothetical protein